jgi:hypothetical protein
VLDGVAAASLGVIVMPWPGVGESSDFSPARTAASLVSSNCGSEGSVQEPSAGCEHGSKIGLDMVAVAEVDVLRIAEYTGEGSIAQERVGNALVKAGCSGEGLWGGCGLGAT